MFKIGVAIFIFVFIVVKDRNDVLAYFSLIVLTSILNAVVNFIYASRTVELDFSINVSELKQHLKPLLYIFSSIAFISIYTLLDTIMLGFMTDDRIVGLYSTGLKVSRIPMLFIGALGVVLIPKLSEHFHHNRLEDFNFLINKFMGVIGILDCECKFKNNYHSFYTHEYLNYSNIIKITIYFDNGKLKAIHYFNDDTDQLNILRKEMIKNYKTNYLSRSFSIY